MPHKTKCPNTAIQNKVQAGDRAGQGGQEMSTRQGPSASGREVGSSRAPDQCSPPRRGLLSLEGVKRVAWCEGVLWGVHFFHPLVVAKWRAGQEKGWTSIVVRARGTRGLIPPTNFDFLNLISVI